MDEAYLEVNFNTPYGNIQGNVGVDTGPMYLCDLVSTATELTDIIVGRAIRVQGKAGKGISCKAGCGVCCCQMVPVSPPEAFYLAGFIDSLGDKQRIALLRNFDNIVKVLDSQNMLKELFNPEYTDAPVLAIAKKYFALKIPCPFLVEGFCSIYLHRPVACREYNVLSPPSWCADPYKHDIEKLPMPTPLSAPLSRLTARLTSTRPRLIPLSLVPLWVSENSALREMTWPGLELFKAFMAEIGGVKAEGLGKNNLVDKY